MTNLVLDFGSDESEPVFRALLLVLAESSYKILVLSPEEEAAQAYREYSGTLDMALSSLRERELSSVQIRGGGVIAGVCCPKFADGVLEDWSAWVEGVGAKAELGFDRLLRIDGLKFVCVSVDDSPEFNSKHITKETFPWSYWRLVVAAVRCSDGAWHVERSPSLGLNGSG